MKIVATRRTAQILAMAMNVVLTAVCMSFTTIPIFASTEAAQHTRSRTEHKPVTSRIPGKVKVTGSAYVCLASGFGQMGRCILRRPSSFNNGSR